MHLTLVDRSGHACYTFLPLIAEGLVMLTFVAQWRSLALKRIAISNLPPRTSNEHDWTPVPTAVATDAPTAKTRLPTTRSWADPLADFVFDARAANPVLDPLADFVFDSGAVDPVLDPLADFVFDAPAAATPIAIAPFVRSREPSDALERSVRGLLVSAPEMSAFHTLSRPQAVLLLTIVAIFVVALALNPISTLVAFNGLITTVYLVAFGYNIRLFRALLRKPELIVVTDEEATAIPPDQLPSYTVLVAAYQESEIIADTIRALEALDYPRDRLDVVLLLEANDSETIQAAIAAWPAPNIRIVAVPDVAPRTKPKACNYGLQLSSGELVTIFDAEDRPDRLQLRRAAAAFARLPADVGCLQAMLKFHNERQNLITKWFSSEYVTWFASVLPALAQLRAPLPLGGTSMHIRRELLDAVGAWDPFNVTEDADLGIRLARSGYRTLVLDSVTSEEANSDFINWVKQRSRWYKGYLQTWLVHMRHPWRLWRELGPGGFLGFQMVIGATPLLALLNPLFWLLTALWFLSGAHIVQVLFPAWVFYPALVSVVFGNFLALYRTMVSVRAADHPGLVIWALLLPIYWAFMSIAAMRAFVQLFVAPSFWEKTMHGLDPSARAQASALGSSR